MNKPRFWLTTILITLTGLWLYWNRVPIETLLANKLINIALKDVFNGSIVIHKAEIDRGLRIGLESLSGSMAAKTSPVHIKIAALRSQDNLFQLALNRPIRFKFSGLQLAHSSEKGIEGEFTFSPGKIPGVRNSGRILGLDLHDLTWADPKNLQGASGLLTGTYSIASKGDWIEEFEIQVDAPKGGQLQAKFFSLLKQYLPQLQTHTQMQALVAAGGTVPYQNASLNLKLENADTMKVLLKILVKDYNLQLNLNMEIRLDEKNAFFQAAQVLGLLEISSR